MGRNRLDLEDATTELNRLLPHNLHVELLCYWLQEIFGRNKILTGTQKLRNPF
jgi:hypothetical protein